MYSSTFWRVQSVRAGKTAFNNLCKEGLELAYKAARMSHDPSTMLGSILAAIEHGQIGKHFEGYNHLPKGLTSEERELILSDRDLKLAYMIHAEEDVVLKAARSWASSSNLVLFCPWYACSTCARMIAGSGITKVVGHSKMFERTPDRWKNSIALGDHILDKAGVERIVWYGDVDCDFQLLFNGTLYTP